jgi:hypothetical protein
MSLSRRRPERHGRRWLNYTNREDPAVNHMMVCGGIFFSMRNNYWWLLLLVNGHRNRKLRVDHRWSAVSGNEPFHRTGRPAATLRFPERPDRGPEDGSNGPSSASGAGGRHDIAARNAAGQPSWHGTRDDRPEVAGKPRQNLTVALACPPTDARLGNNLQDQELRLAVGRGKLPCWADQPRGRRYVASCVRGAPPRFFSNPIMASPSATLNDPTTNLFRRFRGILAFTGLGAR